MIGLFLTLPTILFVWVSKSKKRKEIQKLVRETAEIVHSRPPGGYPQETHSMDMTSNPIGHQNSARDEIPMPADVRERVYGQAYDPPISGIPGTSYRTAQIQREREWANTTRERQDRIRAEVDQQMRSERENVLNEQRDMERRMDEMILGTRPETEYDIPAPERISELKEMVDRYKKLDEEKPKERSKRELEL